MAGYYYPTDKITKFGTIHSTGKLLEHLDEKEMVDFKKIPIFY